jgi:hypothetical protein
VQYVVEVQQANGTWKKWGGGNTRRMAEVSKASAERAYPGAKVRIRREA